MKEILKVNNLNKHYEKIHAVKSLNLKVKEGNIFGLIGPNGAGKSTTIECILGTKKSKSDEITILGMTLDDIRKDKKKHKKLFSQLGVQFQSNFYPEHIRVDEMCEMITSLYDDTEDWHLMLKKFDLEEKKKALVKELSGGQKQKLSVLLALINKPKLVFLDELTTGLDPNARREVWTLLKKLNKEGLTIFLTSHYMDEVEYLCDHIAIIKNGIIVKEGNPKKIKENIQTKSLEEAYLKLIKEGYIDEVIKSVV